MKAALLSLNSSVYEIPFCTIMSISFLTRSCYITQYILSVFFVLFIPLAENEWKFAGNRE